MIFSKTFGALKMRDVSWGFDGFVAFYHIQNVVAADFTNQLAL